MKQKTINPLTRFPLYVKLAETAFISLNAYKINTFIKIFYNILLFVIQVCIWQAVYLSKASVSTAAGAITLQDMIIYSFLSALISVFVNFETSMIPQIGRLIRSGAISMYLIRPITLKEHFLAEYIGKNLYKLLFQFIPLAIIIIFFSDISLSIRLVPFMLFLWAVINGGILYFLITYTFGLLTFWFMSIGNLHILINSFIALFSGSIIPLWFLPERFFAIFSRLPFTLIYFSPISIYMQKVSLYQSFEIIGLQFIWIAVFSIASKMILTSGVKKLVTQGG